MRALLTPLAHKSGWRVGNLAALGQEVRLPRFTVRAAALLSVVVLALAFHTLLVQAGKPIEALSAEERAWLNANRDSIILWYKPDFPPIEFHSDENGFEGLGADVTAMIEERLGVRFKKLPAPDWNEHLSGLESGECAIAPAIVRTPDREQYAHFTAPYATVPMAIITARAQKKDMTLDDLVGLRVAVVSGYAAERFVKDKDEGGIQVVTVQAVPLGLRAVSFGEVDAFVGNLAVAAYHIDKEGLPNLRVAGTLDVKTPWSIGVSKKYPLLFTAIQKALRETPESTLETARKRWISLEPHSGLNPETLRALKVAGLFVLALVLSLGVISYLLKRRLNEKVQSLREAQQELHTNAERLSLALEVTSDGLWDWNYASGECYFSPRWHAMLGYSPQDLPLDISAWESLLHPQEREDVIRKQAEALSVDDDHTHEYRARAKDGGYRWMLSRCRVVKRGENGEPLRVVGVNADITERKLADVALRESEERYRSVIENIGDMFYRTDAEGRLSMVSPSTWRQLGYSANDDILGRPVSDFWLHPGQRQALLARLKAEGRVVDYEVTLKNRAGEPMLVSTTSTFYYDSAGHVLGVEGIFRDITERKRLEQSLAEQLALRQALMETIPYALFFKDAQGRFLGFNKAYEDCFGVRREELVGKSVLDLDFLPMADRLIFHAEDTAAIASASQVHRERALPFADGQLHQTLYSVNGFHQSDGSPGGLIGMIIDITERKRAEEALRELLQRLNTITATVPVVLYELVTLSGPPAHNHFTYVSEKVSELLGVSAQALVNDPAVFDSLVHPADQDELHTASRQAMLHAGPFQHEFRVVLHNGEVKWLRTSSRPNPVEGGPPTFSGYLMDITSEKLSELALAESEQRYRTIFDNTPMGIFRTSFEGQFIMANRTLAEMVGYDTPAALIAAVKDVGSDLYYDESFKLLLRQALLNNPTGAHVEVEFRRKDGSRFHAAINASLQFDAEGRPSVLDGTIEDINERKKSEEALRESETRFRAFMENMPGMVAIKDAKRRVLYLNQRFQDGFAAEDWLGHSADEFMPPELAEKVRLGDERALRDGLAVFDERWEDRSGTPRLIEARKFRIDLESRPSLLGVILTDITERRYNEEKYRVLFETSPEAIFLMQNGVYVDCNPQALALFGCGRGQLLGTRPVDFSPPLQPGGEPSENLSTQLRLQAEAGRPRGFEWLHRRADGTLFTAEVSLSAMQLFDDTYVLAFLRDISERRQMQELMVQTEKMMSVGGLAAGMAHELNNPLGIILQSVQNMQRRLSPALPGNAALAHALGLDLALVGQYMRGRGIEDYIHGIQEAGERAAKIIRTMLDFSRSSQSARISCPASEMLDTAVGLAANDYDLKKLYDFKGIRIERDYDQSQPKAQCTETEIVQVLLNIIKNAAQAMSGQGQGAKPPVLRLLTRRVGQSVRIEIGDNGPGMDDATRKRVFEPFFTTKPQGEGTGLGLSVGFFIITQKHNGTITVESQPGKGTTFAIELPLG